MVASINIKKLHPLGVLEKVRKMREEDMEHYKRLKENIVERVNCYICKIDKCEKIFEKEGFDFVRCQRCGLVYVNPRLVIDKIKDLYNSQRFKYQFENLFIKSSKYRQEHLYSQRLRWIDQFIKGEKLLDIGSATGHFLQSAQNEGWKVTGIEISKYAYEYSTKELKLKVINSTLAEANFPEKLFDVVTVWDTLEHMIDPLENLVEIRRVLQSKGMIFAITPNFDSAEVMLFGKDCDTIVPDAHLIYFDKKTLGKLFETAGFTVVDIQTKGIDIDHAIFNIKNILKNKYDTKFLEDKKQILQDIIDLAGKGNFIFIAAKKTQYYGNQ